VTRHLRAVPSIVAKIGDVARRAGVSPATVSRVLNGTGRVTSDRAERVRAAAAALGYQPYGPAQALRQRRTRVWAAIVADVENPFFTSLVRGIEDVAQERGYRLVLCNSDEDLGKEAGYVEIAIAERMAGVVIAVTSTTDSVLAPLAQHGIPVVAVDRRPTDASIDSVLIDNRQGAAAATEHLLARGSRRIACVTGPARVSTATERLAGYEDALRRHGRPVVRSLVRRADFRQEGGHRAARSLLALPDPPDGLLVCNNLMTLGALHAIREAGLRVPEDIALVGFDEAPWAALTSPPLSVVEQPAYEMGRAAALRLAAGGAGDVRHLVLAPTLRVRASSERTQSHPEATR
jgi:LacI family transcriptional regulator